MEVVAAGQLPSPRRDDRTVRSRGAYVSFVQRSVRNMSKLVRAGCLTGAPARSARHRLRLWPGPERAGRAERAGAAARPKPKPKVVTKLGPYDKKVAEEVAEKARKN